MKNPICAAMLATVLGLMSANIARAQTFTVLHSFSDTLDGYSPWGSLVLSSNTLYGVTADGPSGADGTVFKVNTDGTGFTTLYNISGTPTALTVSGNTLYGMTYIGGSSYDGTVFRMNTDGTGFTNLHSFTGIDGRYTETGNGLVVSGNTLYGTTLQGGSSGSGTIFKMNTDGTGFTNLYSFTALSNSYYNSDGFYPRCTLVLCSNVLYGTAQGGGSSGDGTVYSLNIDGTGFTNLHNFTGGSDGAEPFAGLIIAGGTLYGTTYAGGSAGGPSGNGFGTLFAINTDGSGYTNLHVFSGDDGGFSGTPLFLNGSTLYGTSSDGGSNSTGALFAMNTNGTGFRVLHCFASSPNYDRVYPGGANSTNIDGISPYTGVIVSGTTLFGTTEWGGLPGDGTVFSMSFAPQLSMAVSGTNLTLSWPTNVSGFDYSGFALHCSTNPAATGSWMPVSLTPACVHGQYVATNSISGAQMFYRLIR